MSATVPPVTPDTVMSVVTPLTVVNQGDADLVVKGNAAADKVLKPGETLAPPAPGSGA